MTTRDDIHKIKQVLECACKNNEANLEALDKIQETLQILNTITLRANWTTEIGNSIQYTYEPVTNNVLTAEFYTGVTLVFTQTFTYDVNNNCTSITTT